ncbi:Bud site selection protein bud4, partial [Ceratobasidium sp. 423]
MASIECGKLAFSLPIKIRKHSHIVNEIRLLTSTPKKQPKQALLRRPTPVMEDHLDIVERWDTRLFKTSDPLIGEWSEDSVRDGGAGAPSAVMSTHTSQRPIGVLVLHIFGLPPLPGVPPETLPQSVDGCHWGLSAAGWHTTVYYQGSVTQNGGDIRRQRQFRIDDANVTAYNDLTGKAIAT